MAQPAPAPPPVSPSDGLLASIVPLPPNPRIAHAAFAPANPDPSPCDLVEAGRRFLLARNDALPLLAAILPHAHIDGRASVLHAFAFTSLDHADDTLATLRAISLDGLAMSDVSLFDPQCLYPCPSDASPSDLHSPRCTPVADADFSAANLLPRTSLRVIYSRFTTALRARVIDDITKLSLQTPRGRAHRLMDGFLLTSVPISNEWAAEWLNDVRLRPLVHCQLEVHLSPSRLELYSHFRTTDLLPLTSCLPMTPGAPITLLPFGVPSYYLSTYSGPTSAITSQFEQSLVGLGAGEWKATSPPPHSEKQNTFFRSGTLRQVTPTYIIAWIAVQNKQGEDKGVTIIWPLELCLAFVPSSHVAHARRALPFLPDLSPQLQPSPPPPPPPSVALPTSSGEVNALSVSTPPILGGRPLFRRPAPSPTSDSVRALRCLTLSKSWKLDNVVSEIGLYVESVAKEREKERERIRKERENAQTSSSPRNIATPSASTILPSSSSVTILADSPAAHSPAHTGHVEADVQALSVPVQSPTTGTSDGNIQPPYPSPPSAVGKASQHPSTRSGSAPGLPSSVSQAGHASPALDPPFDPFESMNTTWTQPPNDFMDIDGTYDMNFDMNVGNIGARGGGGTTGAGHANMDFEDEFTFTEDDFDYFDRPSGTAQPAQPILEGPSVIPPAGSGFSPSILGDGTFSVTTTFTPGQQQSSPFTNGGAEPFTPRFSELYHVQDLMLAGAMTLPSPGPTLDSEPATPQVKLSVEDRKSSAVLSNFFDPIPFANSHRVSDSKYHMGKFALPSPPDEEDRTQPIPPTPSVTEVNHWKGRYDAATNPWTGVLKKLIGVKRKSLDGKPHKVWRPSRLQANQDQDQSMSDDAEGASEIASEDDDSDNDETLFPPRTTTPPPAYLPPGPTLLHMQFSHPYLLPMSRPLRPPSAAVAPMSIPAPVTASVPTPVSPAAALGAASEKSKSLEAAGSMIAREVVENSIFADAWRANNTHCLPCPQSDIRPTDVSALAQIIKDLPALEGPVELRTFLQHDTDTTSDQVLLQRMETPMISVGKGDAIIQVSPASLRFWEKLGLTPRMGKKDLTAFLFFEDNGLDKQQLAEAWLKKLSAAYTARQLGAHNPGAHSLCPVDGLFALRLDSLRKYLTSFTNDLPPGMTGVVLYIVIPDSALTLSSPLLRQVSSAMKRMHKARPEQPITFQLIPEHHITSHDLGMTNFDKLCFSVYHRVPQPVYRTMSRSILDAGKESQEFFRDPPFTLARSLKPAVHFNLGPVRTLDVLDRHTFLHVGYRFSACGKWLLVACVDQRGESYNLGSWLTQDEADVSAVAQVWNFALQVTRRTNVEWRMVIAKLGLMSPTELDAWIHHLSTESSVANGLAPVHVTILSVDPSISWSLMHLCQPSATQQTPPRRPSGKDSSSKSLYVDVTAASTYAIYPDTRIPLFPPPAYPWADCSFIPDQEGTATTETCPILPIRSNILLYVPFKRAGPTCSTVHIHFLYSCKFPGSSLLAPDDVTFQEITRNYYELAVLASLQGSLAYPILPLHLSALESMHDALKQDTE